MTKVLTLFAFLSLLFGIKTAEAVDIPDYIEDVENVRTNVNLIIDNLTSKAEGDAQAQEDAEYVNGIMRQLAASLYAEALTTRTNLLKAERDKAIKKKKDGALGKLTGGTNNKKDILADEVQPKLRSIAERLNVIVSLEAGIANLEGTAVITSVPKIESELKDSGGEEN